MELTVIKTTISLMEETVGNLMEFSSNFVLDLSNIELIHWGMIMSNDLTPQSANYRAYPVEFTHEPGVFIFGIKDDYTPQSFDPEVRIKLNVKNRTWEVSNFSEGWKETVADMQEDGRNSQLTFTFRKH